MKKLMCIFGLFSIVLVLLLACKTEASPSEDDTNSTPPVKHKVTVIPNGGTGLTNDEFTVEDGKPFTELTVLPTMTYANLVGYKDDQGNTFELNKTPVTRDMQLILQWEWKDFKDCSGKTDTIENYVNNSDVEGIACKIGTNIDVKLSALNTTGFLAAASWGSIESVKYFLEHGADTKQKDGVGNTAFLIASGLNDVDVVKYLEYKGLSVTERNNNSETALIKAAYFGRTETVKYLLTLPEVTINEKDKFGMTPLMSAANNFYDGSLDTVKYLATYSGVSLKEVATGGINQGLDALGIAKTLPQSNAIAKSIVEYLTTLW